MILPQAFRGAIAPLGSVLIALTRTPRSPSIIGVAEASGLMKEIIENETASVAVFFVFALGLRDPHPAGRACSSPPSPDAWR